jgi:hypothetical protein
VNAILSYVRRGSVLAVATLKGTRRRASSSTSRDASPTPGQAAEVRLPAGSLIGAIIRGDG